MKKLAVIALLSVSLSGFAQKIKLVEGDLSPLKGETSINVEFTYDDMVIGNKKKPEAEYIAEKKADYNKKEPGRGDKWERDWVEDRKTRYEPKFRELFADHSKMTTTDENAKYTMIYHTTKTEPGFNIGITRQSAFTDAEVTIVETQNKGNVIAKITLMNAPGSQFGGYDFDSGVRIAESYAKAGKELAGFIKSKTKK